MIHMFYSLISFIVALFFVMVGVLGILIQVSADIRADVITFILEDSLFILLFSLASLTAGMTLLFYRIANFKKRTIKIKSKSRQDFYLDENIVQDYLKSYWKQLFPHHDIASHVALKKNKVFIQADLPYVPAAEQKSLQARIDSDLKDIFTRLLGYQKDYLLSISFKTGP